MSIFVGGTGLGEVYVGGTPIGEIWVGTQLVWKKVKNYYLFDLGLKNDVTWHSGIHTNSTSDPGGASLPTLVSDSGSTITGKKFSDGYVGYFSPSSTRLSYVEWRPTYTYGGWTYLIAPTDRNEHVNNTLTLTNSPSSAASTNSAKSVLFNSSPITVKQIGFIPNYLHIEYTTVRNVTAATIASAEFCFGLIEYQKRVSFDSDGSWVGTSGKYVASGGLNKIAEKNDKVVTLEETLDVRDFISKIGDGSFSFLVNELVYTKSSYRSLNIRRIWFSLT